uniref:Ig-like domain-containing protein n=1 Tax=Strigamia maritima TaxID=126957 RepID=T1J0S8_STRMM
MCVPLLRNENARFSSLEIKDLRIPAVIQSGTLGPVILDCDYVYEEKEKTSIVVKWYHETGPNDNRTTQQVYQWITTLKPQALGVLKGRLDMFYEASSDPHKKHRALSILQPTINLTGVYKCHVSSNYNDAVKWQKMVIYSPAQDMKLINTKLTELNKVNVSCSAEGIYPEPYAEMMITKGRKTTRTVVNDATQVITSIGGLYNITVFKIFDDASLAAETQFECNLTVPETNYSLRKSLTYYPGHDSEPYSEANSANRRLTNRDRSSTDPSLADSRSTSVSTTTVIHRRRKRPNLDTSKND